MEWGVYEPGEGNGKLVYEQPGYEVDGSYHSKEGSKEVRGYEWGAKGSGEKARSKGIIVNSL